MRLLRLWNDGLGLINLVVYTIVILLLVVSIVAYSVRQERQPVGCLFSWNL
ncbi:hypothetical protein [Aquibacillus rhizosphaerae]|uniref:Uncharacterized protein n=1 Tax=Aquibacillus rhizosphaerae TaxID=3051431 RepID=A0ABT7L249_9BACI|nr:hypothetical protein [Aquibacillus sp. LR5S19]MDL4839240.1 hypothetical protein [Aquibacillus sp. LR5S19]